MLQLEPTKSGRSSASSRMVVPVQFFSKQHSTMKPLRVLLSEGSSLSARQTISALGKCGYQIEVLDSQPRFCLARFSKFVRRIISVPSFGTEPQEYYQAILKVLRENRFDVLIPTHDQVYLFSKFKDEFTRYTHLAVPPFSSIQKLQNKSQLAATLNKLGLPTPETRRIQTLQDFHDFSFPFYIKLGFSTAGQGVWQISSEAEKKRWMETHPKIVRSFTDHHLLAQKVAKGTLGVVQSIFQHGELITYHTYQARQLGVGGSAVARVSVRHPEVEAHLQILGKALHWHGALMLDYLYDPEVGPSYVDANPRIGETWNAELSGNSLCQTLVEVSLGNQFASARFSKSGTRTHSILMALLAEARIHPSRIHLLGTWLKSFRHRDMFEASQDENTPLKSDWLSVIPASYVLLHLLLNPRSSERLTSKAVRSYALDHDSARLIDNMPSVSPRRTES